MAGLTDTTIAASYDQLLIVDNDGGGNSTTHVAVKDGDGGTTFPITLATDAIMITSTNRLEFGDNASYIHQSADGVLDLVSDTEIEINATTIDINGKVIMSVDSATDNVIIESVDGGAATAPDLVLYRNSASPADNDYIGQLLYRGRNDNSQDVSYVEISGVIIDASDGTEDSALYMFTMANGSQVNTMTLDRGNVGIGNASPASALTVKGGSSEYVNIGTVTESTSGRKSLNIMYDSSDNVSKIQSHHQGSAYTALCLQPNGGDVGIGVSSPNIGGWNVNYNVLTIKGDTTNYGGVLELANPDSTGNYFGSVSFVNLDGGSGVVAQARFSATRDGADDASAFVFETEPTGGAVTERMRITSDGKVGINETSPNAKLDVDGDIQIEGANALLLNHTTGGASDTYINSPESNKIAFRTGGVERFYVDLNGTFVIKESTGDPDSTKLYLQSTKSYIDDEYENFDLIGTCSLIMISDTTSTDGALFFASVNSSTVILIADPQGEFRNSDTDGYINCYKSADTTTFHVKNRRGLQKSLSVAIIGCGA